MKINTQVVKPLDIGFVTGDDFLGNCIRVVSSGWNWDMWHNLTKPSHVLFAFPLASDYFAAEMVGQGLELDDSFDTEYFNDKSQRFLGFKRHPVFADLAVQQKCIIELGRLKQVGVSYGYDAILKEIGMHERFSLWFAKIQLQPHELICSGLIDYIVRFAGAKGWSTGANPTQKPPTPLDIWNDPILVPVTGGVS